MPSVDVVIAWGDAVLFASQPRWSLVLGDEGTVDFAIARETLGAARIALVRVTDDVIVTVPRCSHVEISAPSSSPFRHDLARRRTALTDWDELVLPFGARVAFSRGGLSFVVTHGDAATVPHARGARESVPFGCTLASLALHAAFIFALSFAPPASLDVESAPLDRETAAYLQQKNSRAALVPPESWSSVSSDTPTAAGGGGARHLGEQGLLASAAQTSAGRYAMKGPVETVEAQLARAHTLIESSRYGVLGVLEGVLSDAPRDFAGAFSTLGRDPNSFDGALRADHDGDALGFHGLGLFGTGNGGGGDAVGVGLGRVGDYGHGAGIAQGDGYGTGMGWGGGGGRVGTRRARGIICTYPVEVTFSGHLPPESVRRIVRANHPRFRSCYESGLKRDPSLRGSVHTRFVIDDTGAVETAAVNGGTMLDADVRACTRRVFESLSFPEPGGGKVLVTYPIDYDVE